MLGFTKWKHIIFDLQNKRWCENSTFWCSTNDRRTLYRTSECKTSLITQSLGLLLAMPLCSRLPVTKRLPTCSDLTGPLPTTLLAPPTHLLYTASPSPLSALSCSHLPVARHPPGTSTVAPWPAPAFSQYLTPDLALNLFMLVALCVYKHTVG